jgi:hypothetical protein
MTDRLGVEDSTVVAQLLYIALAAEDRSETHAIIGVQWDNWNKLWNCADYYAGTEQDIQSTMSVPVCQKEDGESYHQKIALQRGRRDQMPLFSSKEKTAGKLYLRPAQLHRKP